MSIMGIDCLAAVLMALVALVLFVIIKRSK